MKIRIFSVGIAVFAGKVPRTTYDYFANDSKLSLTHYIPLAVKGEIDQLKDIPPKFQFIKPSNLQNASNLLWYSGIGFKGSLLTIMQDDELTYKDTLIDWQNDLHSDIQLHSKTITLDDSKINPNQAVFVGSCISYCLRYYKSRRYFEAELANLDKFEPNKLTVFYKDVIGVRLIEQLTYDAKIIGLEETPFRPFEEWQKAWWYIPNGELPYDYHTRFAYERLLKS